MKHRSVFVLGVLAVAVSTVLSACSGAAPAFPIGKFVTEADAAVGFDFNADGTNAYYFASKDPILRGTYSVDDSTYTDTTTDGPSSDPACKAPGTYTWSYTGGKLTFKVISDGCSDRAKAYSEPVFVPAK